MGKDLKKWEFSHWCWISKLVPKPWKMDSFYLLKLNIGMFCELAILMYSLYGKMSTYIPQIMDRNVHSWPILGGTAGDVLDYGAGSHMLTAVWIPSPVWLKTCLPRNPGELEGWRKGMVVQLSPGEPLSLSHVCTHSMMNKNNISMCLGYCVVWCPFKFCTSVTLGWTWATGSV